MWGNQAVSESLPLKQKIFGDLATHCRSDAILATNTSSISVTKIAASAVPSGASKDVAFESAKRVLGMWVLIWDLEISDADLSLATDTT